MKSTRFIIPGMLFGATGILWMAAAFCAGQSEGESGEPKGNASATSPPAEGDGRVSVVVARDRATTMHNVYAATLDVMHHRYFHGDRAAVPARALEDVFSEIQRQSKVKAQWISVNLKAMSLDHEPKSDFEKKAAAEIAAGKSELEAVEDGFYRRAGAIPLTGGCVGCHGGFFKEQSKTQKYAGLIISVPVITDPGQSK